MFAVLVGGDAVEEGRVCGLGGAALIVRDVGVRGRRRHLSTMEANQFADKVIFTPSVVEYPFLYGDLEGRTEEWGDAAKGLA